MFPNPAQYLGKKAFTLIEVLVSIALLGIVTGFVLITFQTSRANQALRASSDEFADKVREAHIFSRESKDKKAWGIKSNEPTKYTLIAEEGSTWADVQDYYLEKGIFFENNFSVEFARDSGEANSEMAIGLINEKGKKIDVYISKTGLIELSKMQ
jgi:prepilin-type N-terminal cleavage/methylation domain-containing protein